MKKTPAGAADFLVFDDASALHEMLTRSGFHLQDHAQVTHCRLSRQILARLVWRNRHDDCATLTLRMRLPK